MSVNGVSVDRVEHNYNIVMSHLRKVGTYKQTLAKHPAVVIYQCVRRCLENSPSDALDLAVEFEQLHTFDDSGDFISYLEKQHSLSKTYRDSVLEDMALTELTDHAKILGKKIANRNEVIISQNEYYWLKNCEGTLKKLCDNAGGWPQSLC